MTTRRFWMLVDEMARMSLKADASRLYFGYFWWVLEPLLYVAVFYVVFDVLLGTRQENFLAFLMCGKLTFVWFSKSVVHASRTIVSSKGLIGNIDLPKTLFPMVAIQEGLYRQGAVFALLFGFLILNGYPVTTNWLWLGPVLFVNYLLIAAASLVGAFLVCLVFDFTVVIALSMIFLLFTSGIFWDVRALPDPQMAQWVLLLNPLAFIVDAYRQVLMLGERPHLGHLAGIGVAAAVGIAGLRVLYGRSSQFLALRAITS
ncbi:ABC transporter permease [Congregibacter brevis]|uniref:ABC transporter permease n=1 Tax=Congregibacter brevis TaxID=3081201 RepID=A0ABZ0ICV3_9GAMM|nr:ABC transporter permease [Congregibacter sp. IMCC45268]